GVCPTSSRGDVWRTGVETLTDLPPAPAAKYVKRAADFGAVFGLPKCRSRRLCFSTALLLSWHFPRHGIFHKASCKRIFLEEYIACGRMLQPCLRCGAPICAGGECRRSNAMASTHQRR